MVTMRSGRILLIAVFATSIAAAQATPARPLHQPQQPSRRIQLMIDQWMRAKNWTHQYVEAMPEENFSFKPVPDVRSFAEQMLHLAYWNYGFTAKLFGTSVPRTEEQLMNGNFKTKAALGKVVDESYDFVIRGLSRLKEAQLEEQVAIRPGLNQTRIERLNDAYEHQTHHRGQTVAYLRLKGMVPPPEPF